MYAIRIGDPVADDQIGTLSGAELDALLELYEVLRLTPGNGSLHVEGGNMYTWDHRGVSVTYILLEEQREVAVLRVDRFPVLAVPQGAVTATLSAVTPEARAAELLRKHGVTTFPVPVESIARDEGIRIGRDRHDGPEYGFTCRIDGEGLTVGVNSNTSNQRQRCAVAHGLGHALMHMSEAVIIVCRISRAGSPEAGSTPSLRQEAEATAFCAALVMPEEAAAEAATELAGTLLREAGGCTAFTEAVARRFGVPAEVAAYRLATLGLLSV